MCLAFPNRFLVTALIVAFGQGCSDNQNLDITARVYIENVTVAGKTLEVFSVVPPPLPDVKDFINFSVWRCSFSPDNCKIKFEIENCGVILIF